MYNKNRHLLSKEKYSVLAGSDWPSYEEFLLYKESNRANIRAEMQELLGNEILACYKDTQKQIKKSLIDTVFNGHMYHVWRAFVPGVIGFCVYWATTASVYKFFIIASICYIINFLLSSIIHRWLTHKQFVPYEPFQYLFLFFVTLAGFGNIKNWIGVHLLHHRFSDKDNDPHPANKGFLNTMLVVTNVDLSMSNDPVFTRKLDTKVEFIANNFWVLHVCSLVLVALVDFDFFLLSFLLIKSVLVIQNGLVNYFGHSSAGEFKPNNLNTWTSMLVNGENWHKNHHDNSRKFNQASAGNIDLGYQFMRMFVKHEQ